MAMVNTCVDAHLQKLIRIEHHVNNISVRRRFINGWEDWYTHVLAQIQSLKPELRFLKMFLWRFSTWDDTNSHTSSHKILNKFMCCCIGTKGEEGTNVLMVCRRSTFYSIESIWEQIGGAQSSFADPFLAIPQPERGLWEVFVLRIKNAIFECKLLVEEHCKRLSDVSLKNKCLKFNEILEYLDFILQNLKDLIRYKISKIVSLAKEFEVLEDRVMLLHNFIKLTSNECLDSKNLRDFKSYVVFFASNTASVMFLYWTKAMDGEIVLNTSLFDRLQMIIKPGVPEVMLLYFDALRAIKLERFDGTLLLGQVVANFVDILLENHVKDDAFQVLRDGLIFLLTFRADPPTRCNDLISIFNEIDVLLGEGSGVILQLDSDKGKMHLSDFVTKIETLKDRIIQRYVRIPDSSLPHFPVTNGLGFLDYLLQNLRHAKEKMDGDSMFIPFAKYHVIKIEEKLKTLRPFLNDFHVLQNELKLEVINLAYLTEHVVKLCSVILYPIWYNMSYLSYVVDQIALLNGKTEKIKECKMHMNGGISYSVEILSEQYSYSRTDEEVVGFDADADILIEKLRWGYRSFDVVPIVGMPGIGKTTMARKVYNSPIIRNHFNIFPFCTVSQVHNIRKLFLDILRDIIILDAKILSMTEHDLAHQLRKCLYGQRYLIVMDDMWDISAWNEVRSSFPENNDGSRVIITTRSHNVALKANGGSPHILHLLSDDYSWELLQKKVFCNKGCPQNLLEVGKVIAKNCKGLPLAVVLVAGLLSRSGKSRSSWSKIAETTCSYASMEGCKDIIELSYKRLPEYLKPCFLYFGAFAEDEAISAKRLMMLWIAEGFVQKSETRSIETVAREYLNDLVDRSLVIVFKTSSCGGISTCGVHDLLYDFCQTKAKDENFSHLVRGLKTSNSSISPAPNFYRVFIQRSYVEAEATGPNTHSLLYCHDNNDSAKFHLRSLKLVQVLHLGKIILTARDFHCITSLVHLRYIAVSTSDLVSVPSTISNLHKLETFILVRRDALYGPVSLLLPRTIWTMKRLRHVDVGMVHFDLNTDLEDDEAEAYSKKVDGFHVLDIVQRFSWLTLSAASLESDRNETDLLKRLPNVVELSCCLDESWESSVSSCNHERVLTFDFLIKLESLKLYSHCYRNPFVIFPSNLKKLTLSGFSLSWTGFSAIRKLPCLEVLKIHDNSDIRWETEDIEFPNLKFLKLMDMELKIWNASVDTFPCLERLVLKVCKNLVEIPPSFGDLVTLISIEVYMCNNGVATSAVEIQNEQMNYGNKLQTKISNYFED